MTAVRPAGDRRTWSRRAAMSSARQDMGTAVVAAVEVYDPKANSWSTVAPMSVPRHHTAGGVIGRKLYVVGGRGHSEAATALEEYDPQTDTWTTLAPMPTGRSGIAAGVVHEELYVFGGEGARMFHEVEVYDPRGRRWERLRSEEHTSELQSHSDLVCRLLLEKKKTTGDVYT